MTTNNCWTNPNIVSKMTGCPSAALRSKKTYGRAIPLPQQHVVKRSLQAIDMNGSKVQGKDNKGFQNVCTNNLAASAAGSPSWFLPALDLANAPFQAQLDTVAVRQAGMESRLQNMETRFAMIEARQMSVECRQCRTEIGLRSSATDRNEPLCELWNAQFEILSCFPATLEAVDLMNEHCNILPNPIGMKEKRLAIQRFIGIHPGGF